MLLGLSCRRTGRTEPPVSASGSKRPASTEDLLPATSPATKLHKDTGGDVATAATASAAPPRDSTDTALVSPAAATVQVPQGIWTALLAKVESLEGRVTEVSSELAAAKADFDSTLQQHTQISMAREAGIKDDYMQRLATLEGSVEYLNQRIRSKNMVVHGIPDNASLSKPADLERFVKQR